MGWTFGELCVGDLFNTKAARWVKTSESEGICVMSGLVALGKVRTFDKEIEVVLLWSTVLNTNRSAT